MELDNSFFSGKQTIPLLAISFVAACGTALLPQWERDMGLSIDYATSYLSSDKQSLFVFEDQNNNTGLLSKVSMDRELLQTWQTDFAPYHAHHAKVFPLADNKAYWLAPVGSGVVFFDPDNSEFWSGLTFPPQAEPEDYGFSEGVLIDGDKLVIAGLSYRTPLLLLVNQQGMVEAQLDYPNLKSLPLHADFRASTVQIFIIFHVRIAQQAQRFLPCFRSKSLAIKPKGKFGVRTEPPDPAVLLRH